MFRVLSGSVTAATAPAWGGRTLRDRGFTDHELSELYKVAFVILKRSAVDIIELLTKGYEKLLAIFEQPTVSAAMERNRFRMPAVITKIMTSPGALEVLHGLLDDDGDMQKKVDFLQDIIRVLKSEDTRAGGAMGAADGSRERAPKRGRGADTGADADTDTDAQGAASSSARAVYSRRPGHKKPALSIQEIIEKLALQQRELAKKYFSDFGDEADQEKRSQTIRQVLTKVYHGGGEPRWIHSLETFFELHAQCTAKGISDIDAAEILTLTGGAQRLRGCLDVFDTLRGYGFEVKQIYNIAKFGGHHVLTLLAAGYKQLFTLFTCNARIEAMVKKEHGTVQNFMATIFGCFGSAGIIIDFLNNAKEMETQVDFLEKIIGASRKPGAGGRDAGMYKDLLKEYHYSEGAASGRRGYTVSVLEQKAADCLRKLGGSAVEHDASGAGAGAAGARAGANPAVASGIFARKKVPVLGDKAALAESESDREDDGFSSENESTGSRSPTPGSGGEI